MRAVLIDPTPNASDVKWMIWAKMLCEYQQHDSADPANDLNYTDPKWMVKQKLLQAINHAG